MIRPFSIRQSYSFAFWAVYSVFLFTQLNWAAGANFLEDIIMRLSLAFGLTLFLTPLIHFILSLLIDPFLFKKKPGLNRYIAGLFLPFYSILAYLFIFYSTGYGSPHVRATLFIFCGAVSVAWYIFSGIKLSRESHDLNEIKSLEFSSFLGQTLKWYLKSTVRLLRNLFFPEKIMNGQGSIPAAAYPLLAAHLLILFRFGFFMTGSVFSFVILLIATFFSLTGLSIFLDRITGKNRYAKGIMFFTFYTIYFILIFYQFNEFLSLDYSLIHTNFKIMFHESALKVYKSRVRADVLIGGGLFLIWCIFLQIRFHIFTKPYQRYKGKIIFTLYPALLLFLSMTQTPVADEGIQFTRSIYRTIQERQTLRRIKATLENPWPYYKQAEPSYFAGDPDKPPDIILLLMESFNQTWTERKAPNGKEVTPYFNQLLHEGLYVENYYGNAIQTARALINVFSGIYPSYREKVFRSHQDLNLHALPEILQEHGYRTLFYNCHRDASFDNKGPSLLRLGFDEFIPMLGPLIQGVPRQKFWNWGLQDDEFYKIVCNDLKKRNSSASGNSPFFASLLSLSQHHPHNSLPADLCKIYPDAERNDLTAYFINSQNASDTFLKEFIRQVRTDPRLSKAIIIITGDHSFPGGDYSNFNEKGFHEENFRVPLLILWDGKIQPQRITNCAYSHLNLGPTILDLAEISAPNHFLGKSIFSDKAPAPFCLSQPYDGNYEIAVDWPYKYVKRMSGNAEMLFKLDKDPMEKTDLSKKPAYKEHLSLGRSQIRGLQINQILIEENKIWPGEETEK